METFVVRIWSGPGQAEDRPGGLRGVVEHLGTSRSAPFRDDAELLAFLHARPLLHEHELEVGSGDRAAP